MLPFFLKPKMVTAELDLIDREPPSYTLGNNANGRVFVILFSVTLSLLAIHYLKAPKVLNGILGFFMPCVANLTTNSVYNDCNSLFATFWYYAWWGFCNFLTYVAIPMLVIKYFFKERVRDYGWRWGETHLHWQGYGALLSIIAVLAIVASFRSDFTLHYPFYPMAGRSWLDLLMWEAVYLSQFVFLEFFFRGFLLNALRPHYGSAAIMIMVVPYMMMHLQKPWLEATGSVFFGLFLGILALRSRSIWGGVFVHVGVALAMDVSSLIQQNKWPHTFLPF